MRLLRRCRRGSRLGSGWAPSVLCGAPVSAAALEGLDSPAGGVPGIRRQCSPAPGRVASADGPLATFSAEQCSRKGLSSCGPRSRQGAIVFLPLSHGLIERRGASSICCLTSDRSIHRNQAHRRRPKRLRSCSSPLLPAAPPRRSPLSDRPSHDADALVSAGRAGGLG